MVCNKRCKNETLLSYFPKFLLVPFSNVYSPVKTVHISINEYILSIHRCRSQISQEL